MPQIKNKFVLNLYNFEKSMFFSIDSFIEFVFFGKASLKIRLINNEKIISIEIRKMVCVLIDSIGRLLLKEIISRERVHIPEKIITGERSIEFKKLKKSFSLKKSC